MSKDVEEQRQDGDGCDAGGEIGQDQGFVMFEDFTANRVSSEEEEAPADMGENGSEENV